MTFGDKILGYIFAIISIIGIILGLVLGLTLGWDKYAAEILIFSSLSFAIGLILAFAPLPKQALRYKWQYVIKIDNENINYETHLFNIQSKIIPILAVKKVIDEGDFYCIIYQEYSNCIVCQKNLLKSGTIEDFEKFFEGKIKRKSKTAN